jgi:hypothetical protein
VPKRGISSSLTRVRGNLVIFSVGDDEGEEGMSHTENLLDTNAMSCSSLMLVAGRHVLATASRRRPGWRHRVEHRRVEAELVEAAWDLT